MVDSYYGIGEGHLVCQDYALHGSLDDMEYVIISDGCSGAEHSEVGAQILCHAAKYHIISCYQNDLLKQCSSEFLVKVLGNAILKRVDEIRKIYPINKTALEATLLIAIRIGLKLYLFIWGDGIIIENIQINESRIIKVINIDYENKPFYLVSDKNQYMKKWGMRYYKEQNLWGIKNKNSDIIIKDKEMSYLLPFYEPYIYEKDLKENDNSITLCSDGILSFKDENKNLVDLLTIVNEFITFKTIVNGFVKKRMFFMRRKIKNKNWSYYDDISTGTIIYEL